MRRTRVDIIISTYNAAEFMMDCFEALRKNTKWPCNLVITDDCSVEQALRDYLLKLRNSGQAKVLLSRTRRGFAGNNAWAIGQTSSPYFCLLNQDTVPQEFWLTHMMETMRSGPKIGIVGARLLFPPGKAQLSGTIQHVAVGRTAGGIPYHPYRERPADFRPANVLRDVNAVTGACMLFRRKCWEDMNGFDQRYSMGQFEDVDLCWRARERGWRIVVQPKALLYHYEHGCGEVHVQEGHDKNRALLLETWHHLKSDEHLFPEGARDDYVAQ